MQNAYLWQPIATITGVSYATVATANVVGGGGGFSIVEPEPSSQKLVSGTSDYQGGQYLTPTDYQSDPSGSNFVEPTSWSVTSTRPVVSGGGSGRAEPDVSADADPYSGYLLYEPSFAGVGQATFRAAGRHEFRGAAVQRLDRGHRLLSGAPDRAVEPERVLVRSGW